ncbi:MAG: hypothetical protein CVV30_08255 [Methanomicrobiales archaeon HGW-Methanomicrobiales-1]|nr:MAG: hypothetical protein CVV30_08255 [Methanomicrobiales archaeon HGW-Methanomicrobiales-1]
MRGSHVHRFDDWQKTKIDVVASPFTIDTNSGNLLITRNGLRGKQCRNHADDGNMPSKKQHQEKTLMPVQDPDDPRFRGDGP